MKGEKMNKVEKEIIKRIREYENPKRIALSSRYTFLKKPILLSRYFFRGIKNFFDLRLTSNKDTKYFEYITARHQSVLRRKLGTSDQRLQEQKITNIKQAIKELNGTIIPPGKTFSLWKTIGKPKYKSGYVDGMLLSNGKVVEGLGGGLCQLSNFLYWIFLHTPSEVIERYHHSMDVFPDSGRVLPFGTGATILYNFIDLKIKNTSKHPLQIKVWLTGKHLKGQILSSSRIPQKYHIFEKNHYFIKRADKYFRFNEIFREKRLKGKTIQTEKVTTNFAPVLYEVTREYLQKNNFKVRDFTGE